MLYSEPQTASQNNIYFASFEASVLPNLDSATLAGFRKGLREHAVSSAQKTLSAGALATVTIVQMATLIQDMKAQLNRKEFGVFIKDLLQMVGSEARKYLDIARAFRDFELSRLQKLEPLTLLKLRSKRYLPVVERLRSESDITSLRVQELIEELVSKQPTKKATQPISGWKQSRSGGGRYYNLLLHDEKTGLLIEQQAEAEGILPERVIMEAIALRAQQKQGQVQVQVKADPEEPDSVQEDAQPSTEELEVGKYLVKPGPSSHHSGVVPHKLSSNKGPGFTGFSATEDAPTASAELAHEQPMVQAISQGEVSASVEEVAIAQPEVEESLQEMEQAMPPLVTCPEGIAQVTRQQPTNNATTSDEVSAVAQPESEESLQEQTVAIAVPPEVLLAGEDRAEIELLLNAPIGKVEEIIREVALRSAYRALYLLNRAESSDEKRMELLERRVTEYHISIGAVDPTEVTGCLEPEQKSLDKEPTCDDDCSVEKDVQSLSVEPHAGDRVKIVSDRHGKNLVGQVGVVTVANDVGCVVQIADKTLWFCADEIVLALAATPQASAHYQISG